MTTDWTSLEPWYSAICACVVRDEPTCSTSEAQVSFTCRIQYRTEHTLSLLIELETDIPQNVLKLIQIREAMELFTVFSTVDNKAFTERFYHIRQEDPSWYPNWKLYVRGSATVQQATWSSLFAYPDPSSQFKRTIEKLKGMDLSRRYFSEYYHYFHIGWACKDVDMDAIVTIYDCDPFNGMTIALQRLLQASVPLIKQLDLTNDTANLWKQGVADVEQVPMDVTLSITIRDITTTYSRVLAGLASLPVCSLEMVYNNRKGIMKIKALVELNRIYAVVCSECRLQCSKMSRNMLPAIDTIQAIRTDTPIWTRVHSVDSGSWPLLVEAICRGVSVGISLDVKNVILTTSDLLKITDVVNCRRRQSTIGNDESDTSQSSMERNLHAPTAFRWVQLYFNEIESSSLVVDLLGLIGRNLRSLTLNVDYSVDTTLDLNELSAVCVKLELLEIRRIHVVVSGHSEALSRWPIQEIQLDSFWKISDLTLCLQNPNLRMTHELFCIKIKKTYDPDEDNDEQKMELLRHDGDFLSVTAKKVPFGSIIAMASVVNCGRRTKAIHRLHEDVLVQIFTFASTPATRSVYFWSGM